MTAIHPAAMSGAVDQVTSPTGAPGKTSSPAWKAPETPPVTSAPRSTQGVSDVNLESEGSDDDDAVDAMSAAGCINEDGEVVDDDGNPIGRVTGGGDASQFAGYVVTIEGDILDDDGHVVGKAEPLDDEPFGHNYTTTRAENAGADEPRRGDATAKFAKDAAPAPPQRKEGGGRVGGLGGALGGISRAAGSVADGVTGGVGGAVKQATGAAGRTTKRATDAGGDATKSALDTAGDAGKDVAGATGAAEDAMGIGETGSTSDPGSKAPGLTELEPMPMDIPSLSPSVANKVVAMFDGPFVIKDGGKVVDQAGKILGKLTGSSDIQNLAGKDVKGIDEQGNLLGENDTILGKMNIAPEGSMAERVKQEVPEAAGRLDALEAAKQPELPDVSILEGLKINKMGNVVDDKGNPLGKIKSGDLKRLVGKTPDKDGKVWDNRGHVIGEVEALPQAIEPESLPFEDFPDATVDKFGKVIFDGRQVGVVVGDDWEALIGKKVDPAGDVLDRNGNVIGHAERQEEPEAPEEEPIDYSMLRGKKVNKLGNVVDDKGQVWGRVVQGIMKHLNGKKVGDDGQIFNDAGQVIGKAEPVPDNEREDVKEPAPFEDFPDAVVGANGDVVFEGEKVGVVVEGDAQKLKGKPVDADGDILDRAGNALGRAERWEPEQQPEVDMSPLAGKRINKAGNAADSHGEIFGRVIEGNVSRLVGRMCDKNGWIRNEAGDVIGKCELIPEAEREGLKEGPFAELSDCTVNKEGKVVTAGGDVVGRLVSGDAKTLSGRPVDDDGDICDRNGNVLGHAERWEEPEVEKEVNPMSGRKVNREGNIVDENGDVIGKLTTGELSKCAGKKIDDDGDVVDQKGNVLGHCSLLEEIPDPTETDEDREERLRKEQDNEIAKKISICIEQSLDKIKPICKMIVERIDQEEAKSEDDRDEEALVDQVRPLIEEGGKILTEANGVIRGLDPDGRISAQAKHHAAGHEATAEEYHLAELLKELTGTVTETIENAKRKLENLPKAKKAINPLWGLLSEPLFQIVAAVGLLLSGVLGLVGNLLNGLGLGGLVNNLLGGLGISKVLDNLGLGSIL